MKNKTKLISHILSSVVLGVLFLSSTATFAAGTSSVSSPHNFKELINNIIIGGILKPVVYLLVALAVVVFLYGVFKFIRAEGDDKQSGREFILWGIIGIFVMVSVWGLVSVLQNTFKLGNSDINIPKL
ncbi:MAG: hypothetical protein WC631_01645 [Candidatus Paceibacterota bacterium]